MANAVKEGFQELLASVVAKRSQINKFAGGLTTKGDRVAPPQTVTNDETFGVRVDAGAELVKDGKRYKRYKAQIN